MGQEKETGTVDGATTHSRLWLVIGAAVLIIVIVGVLLVGMGSKNTTVKCSDPFLKQAASHLAPDQVNALSKDVVKIHTIKGYDTDPNCLYVVTVYNINHSDYSSAASSLHALQKVYRPNVGFNHYLAQPPTPTYQVLIDQVNFLKGQAQQNVNNTRRIDG